MADNTSELNYRDQKSLLCAACADGYHEECEEIGCACKQCETEAEARAERAQEREFERYWGSDVPVTLGEQTLKAWEEHKR